MLDVSNISASYGHHLAINGVSLSVEAGETVAILGSNGAGKTTLLNALAGRMGAQAKASVIWKGRDISALPAHDIVEAGIAVVPEGRGIFGNLTVSENLSLGAHPRRARDPNAQKRRSDILSYFPRLAERLGQKANTMSGGEQQMVAIGRALMSVPDLLMLDEPSLGLSPLMTSELFRALQGIRSTGTAILIVEQNARKTLALADRAYLLSNGKIVGSGTSDALAKDPAVTAAFLGGATSTETTGEA